MPSTTDRQYTFTEERKIAVLQCFSEEISKNYKLIHQAIQLSLNAIKRKIIEAEGFEHYLWGVDGPDYEVEYKPSTEYPIGEGCTEEDYEKYPHSLIISVPIPDEFPKE